jgi:hypothetical protein
MVRAAINGHSPGALTGPRACVALRGCGNRPCPSTTYEIPFTAHGPQRAPRVWSLRATLWRDPGRGGLSSMQEDARREGI